MTLSASVSDASMVFERRPAIQVELPDAARAGRLHEVSLRGDGGVAVWVAPDGAVVAAARRDGAWSAPSLLAGADDAAVRPRVAVGTDVAAACWVDRCSRVCLRRSQGDGWGPVRHLSPSGSGSAGARLAIDVNDTITVSWNDHGAAIRVVEVDRHGVAVGWAHAPSGYFPAVGAADGAVVAYMGMDGAIWAATRRSPTAWAAPTRLTDSAATSFPAVAVSDGGGAVVAWLDGPDTVSVAVGNTDGEWGQATETTESDVLPQLTWSPGDGFRLNVRPIGWGSASPPLLT